jgi:hypothetical protein
MDSTFEDEWYRFRQVNFTATEGNCKFYTLRFLNADPSVNESISATVWPEFPPDLTNLGDIYDLDVAFPMEITVTAGTTFYTMVSEINSFPNGFAW